MSATAASAAAAADSLRLLAHASQADRTQLTDSTLLYSECIASGRWKPLSEALEKRGYLYLRDVLLESREELASVHHMLRQLANLPDSGSSQCTTSSSLVINIATGKLVPPLAGSSHAAHDCIAAAGSEALQKICRSAALQTLFKRLNAHTGSKLSISLPASSWLRVHTPLAAETPPTTDCDHFRVYTPAAFGSPFRPRWSLLSAQKEICADMEVSRIMTSLRALCVPRHR